MKQLNFQTAYRTPRHFGHELYDLDYFVEMFDDHLCAEVKILAASRKPVTEAIEAKLFASHGLNSYERHVMYLLMTPECLLKTVESCLANCQRISRPLPGCYDEAVVQVFAPLLAMHLQNALDRKSWWQRVKDKFFKKS